jgi:putative peptidoglycan lipid II flippase
VSLIGVAIALAAFPGLSATWAANDRQAFRRLVRTNLLTIGSLTLAAAVGLMIVGPLAIEVFLGGGAFDAEDVTLTATVLAAFSLAIPFDSLSHLLARAVYATHNTLLPVGASIAGFGVNVASTLALVDQLGIVAIPLGFAAGTAVKTLLLGAALLARLRRPLLPVAAADAESAGAA